MVVHIHLLKQGIEVVHPTSQDTYASRSQFGLILRGHRVATATEMVGINLGRAWGHRYLRGIDGPCDVGGVACVMRETLTRQQVTARSGGLDQKALRDLIVSFQVLLYAVVLTNIGSKYTGSVRQEKRCRGVERRERDVGVRLTVNAASALRSISSQLRDAVPLVSFSGTA